jgi:hypothetical protein
MTNLPQECGTVLTAGGFEPRKSPKRMAFTDVDRLVFARLYHLVPWSAQGFDDRKAGDCDPLAPRRLPGLLAQEIRTARGPATDTA